MAAPRPCSVWSITAAFARLMVLGGRANLQHLPKAADQADMADSGENAAGGGHVSKIDDQQSSALRQMWMYHIGLQNEQPIGCVYTVHGVHGFGADMQDCVLHAKC